MFILLTGPADMWGHFLHRCRENHFFICAAHWKETLIRHKHNFMLQYDIEEEKRNMLHKLEDALAVTYIISLEDAVPR